MDEKQEKPYDAVGDALALIGMMVLDDGDVTIPIEAFEEVMTVEYEEDYVDLIAVLTSIAAGLIDVVTDGSPEDFLLASALNQALLDPRVRGDRDASTD